MSGFERPSLLIGLIFDIMLVLLIWLIGIDTPFVTFYVLSYQVIPGQRSLSHD